ncbi:MAG TPA: anti-sigma factor [Variovorax sp.]
MQAADEDNELGALIRREGTRHMPPAGLAERILADLRQAESPRPIATPTPRPAATRPWRWLQALGLFGAGAATAWGLALTLLVAPMQEATSEAVTDSHVRSLMAAHLADVASTDQHTVKPWFAGKLDFSPPVVDLAAVGIPLTGGRLDYIGGRAVAALVYRAGQHVINLFVWPAADATDSAPQLLSRRGYNVVHWTEDGMQAWAVSDLNATELQAFAAQARERIAAGEVAPR